jgi:hypothetical protein
MRRFPTTLFLLVACVAPLTAQFEGSIQMRVRSFYEAETTQVAYVMSVKNDMVAVTTTGDGKGQEGGNFIIRGDKKLMWLLNEPQKSYVEFPLIEDTTAKDQPKPPADPNHQPSLRKTGKSKKILGYQCDEYVGVMEDESSIIWACAKLGRVYDGLFRSLNQMGAGEEPSQGGGWQAELVKLKLFPMSITTMRNGTLAETQEVAKITPGKLPASTFEPPAGYQKVSMENEFQNMLKQMQEQMKKNTSDSAHQ